MLSKIKKYNFFWKNNHLMNFVFLKKVTDLYELRFSVNSLNHKHLIELKSDYKFFSINLFISFYKINSVKELTVLIQIEKY